MLTHNYMAARPALLAVRIFSWRRIVLLCHLMGLAMGNNLAFLPQLV
jgi:hypothetical protein